jgi:hypothetical protein
MIGLDKYFIKIIAVANEYLFIDLQYTNCDATKERYMKSMISLYFVME